jgi:HAD superfamily hydrolase (TIGR01484 family)
MKPLEQADASAFAGIRFVLRDMDETLTLNGRLGARTYEALERLQEAGIVVMPVTGAPAGWCDQMARMWPIDGVIGENGGLFFRRAGHGVEQIFWHADADREAVSDRLARIGERLLRDAPSCSYAQDQAFRLTSLAFERPREKAAQDEMLRALQAENADATVNNLWVLAWLGGYDKLAMSRRILRECHGLDIDVDSDAVLYTGDSTNDAPMFAFFRHSVGVSTVRDCLHELPKAPRWITRGAGGAGFVEAANAILMARGR